MEKETSCGGLVVHDNKVLIMWNEKFRGYGIPKGHVEEGESFLTCALREISEETGLEVVRIGDFEKSLTYHHPIFNTMKTVVLFLFESNSHDIILHSTEDYEGSYRYIWCSLGEAREFAKKINSGKIVLEGLEELRRLGKLW